MKKINYVPPELFVGSGGKFQDSLASCLESLALCFVTALRIRAGAADVYLVCGAFARISVVYAVAYITIDTVNLVLFH